jgi:hypothetical protein
MEQTTNGSDIGVVGGGVVLFLVLPLFFFMKLVLPL